MFFSLFSRVFRIRYVLLVSVIFASGCLTPTIIDSGSFGDFSRLDKNSQQQKATMIESKDELFEVLVYGLVSDRTELVETALKKGADPNGTIDWDFIRRTELIEAEQPYKGPATDEVWQDGGPLYIYSFLLGGWCSEEEKATGYCVLKGPWSVYNAPSSLFPAVALVQSPKALDLMLEYGATVDQELLDGTFHTATRFNRLALAQKLAEMGAQIDSVGVDGMRPMHRAAQFGHPDMIAWLLDQGLDPNTGGAAVEPVSAPAGGRIYLSPGVGQAGVTPLHLLASDGTRGMTIDESKLAPLIGSVAPDGPAGRAGLRAGDLIVSIDERSIQSFGEFVKIIQASPGVQLRVRIERAGQLYDTILTPDWLTNPYGDSMAGATGSTTGGVNIGQVAGQQATGKIWISAERWHPDWRNIYSYNPAYREALERLIAAGAYVNARANMRVMPSWWNATGNLAAFDQTPLHLAHEFITYEIAEGLVENGADEEARLATGETPKETYNSKQLASITADWQKQEAQRLAAIQQQKQQAADSDTANSFGQMMALGGVAAITAYGAGQNMGAEALTMGAGMAADILSDGEAGGIDSASQALEGYAASQRRSVEPVTQTPIQSAPQPTPTTTLPLPTQLAQACENTLSIGMAQHSFLSLSLPPGARIPVQASLLPAQGGQAIRLESTGPVGNATRIVAQILIPDSARQPGNISVNDDNTISGLENGAVGTLDVFRGREYANFRSNFDFGRNRTMGSVQLLEAGSRWRGTFSFDAVEDGYPRRGEQYKADVAGSFCVP